MTTTQTSPAHTPGPWTIHKAPSDRQIQLTGRSNRDSFERDAYIATLPLSASDHPYRPEEEANAHLIAAAPDLLTFAQSVSNAFRERLSCLRDELLEDFVDRDDVNDEIANYEYLLKHAGAVIANAEGKQ